MDTTEDTTMTSHRHGAAFHAHDDGDAPHAHPHDITWARPVRKYTDGARYVTRIGIGGPVGSGKTALIERLVPLAIARGHTPLVITNDIVTQEDARHVRRTLDGILAPERIVGVETGACPHTAVRDDPTINLAVAEELTARFPDADLLFLESGGDNLTLTFSPALVHYFIFVIDVAAGDKIPRKNGPGVNNADLLVINKTDLAPYVGADLALMARESAERRCGKPTLFTNCATGAGLDAVMSVLTRSVLDG
jgi:urease accessory protein